nr:toll-like receptor 3 [Onchidium reevesii]
MMLEHRHPARPGLFAVFILAFLTHVIHVLSKPDAGHKEASAVQTDTTLHHVSGHGKVHSDYRLLRGQTTSMTENNKKEQVQVSEVGERSWVLVQRLCNVHLKEKTVCYQEHGTAKCNCTGGLADCSGTQNVPNLSYVPTFPSDIKCLQFKHNYIKSLDDSFFANVSDFFVIDLSNNYLQTISRHTFGRFTRLKYLILNNNLLSYKALRCVLDYPPTLRLDLVGNNLQVIPKDYFQPYGNISTSQLYMDSNYFPEIHLRELARLTNLEYLSLTNSNINKVVSAIMPALKSLYLNNNNIVTFPETCTRQSDVAQLATKNGQIASQMVDPLILHSIEISYFPSLKQLYIGDNNLASLPAHTDICLPHVVVLQMESNSISQIPDRAFTTLHSLKVLNLDKMRTGINSVGSAPFSTHSLAGLYLSKNKINFSSESISSGIFDGCSDLKVLQIDHNLFSNITETKFSKILGNLPSVESLYLGSCDIKAIPVNAIALMQRLKRLYLYINSIENIPAGAFDKVASLQYLNMAENKLSTIQPDAFSLATRLRLREINLSKNQFLCDCDLLWFQSWMNSSNIFINRSAYMCSNLPSTQVQQFRLSRQACLFSQEDYILFIVCLSILITIFIVFAIFYRYRWRIRLLWYERRAPARDAGTVEQRYRYDLFIVYCNDDATFVHGPMLKRIEKQWGLRTCIHQRDFVAGGSIIDNTVAAMNSSRRILMVVSSRFVLSKWCKFELQLCQSHVIDHDLPSLLVVKLDEIESRDMSSAMYALYNTTCFLELPSNLDDKQAVGNFWRRLKTMLKTLMPADTHTHSTSVKLLEQSRQCSHNSPLV